MIDFYQSEKFKIQLVAATVAVGYVLTMVLLWLRLRHLYGSYVYPMVNGSPDRGNPESFVTWLWPWCVYLAIAAMVSMSGAVLVIYLRCFSGKYPCADCLVFRERTNYTSNFDNGARQYVCPEHMEERRDQAALAAARDRARSESVGECPRCHQPMRKAIQMVLGIYVVSDVCKAHGRFSDWAEAELFAEEAFLAGLHAQTKKSGRGAPDRHAVMAAALHADTAPMLYLDELDAA